MNLRHVTAATTLLAAAIALSACGSSNDNVPSANHPVTRIQTSQAPASPSTSTGATAQQVALASTGTGYQDAVTTFGGADKIQAAADTVQQVIGLAMANCNRWKTPGLDADHQMAGLDSLLTPDTFNAVKASIGQPGSLIVNLPTTIENGSHTPAADAQKSCTVGAYHYDATGLAVSVNKANAEQPRLTLASPVTVDLTLGGTKYTISRAYSFDLIPAGPTGWMVAAGTWQSLDLSSVK